jgi:hypothetical protein
MDAAQVDWHWTDVGRGAGLLGAQPDGQNLGTEAIFLHRGFAAQSACHRTLDMHAIEMIAAWQEGRRTLTHVAHGVDRDAADVHAHPVARVLPRPEHLLFPGQCVEQPELTCGRCRAILPRDATGCMCVPAATSVTLNEALPSEKSNQKTQTEVIVRISTSEQV